MIGLTLKYNTLLTGATGEPEGFFVDSYGGIEQTLEALFRQNVRSIEISAVNMSTPRENVLEIVERLQRAGMNVTIHGKIEDVSADEYLRYYEPVFRMILKRQDVLPITVHALVDCTETVRILENWAQSIRHEWPGVVLAIENQRICECTYEHEKDHFAINAIPDFKPQTDNIGICWDMGHYAYNRINAGLPIDSLPSDEAIKLVRHTHIHSMKEMDTHHPLLEEYPVSCYIKRLQKSGYTGVYNLEVKPNKYWKYMMPKEGIERSISVLKNILGEG